jgi:hypothetical protein
MPGFFEAAANFKPIITKHEVTVEGKTFEVSRDEKIEMIKQGMENYYVKTDGTLALREKKSGRHRFPEIETFAGDPYWPTERFTWKK